MPSPSRIVVLRDGSKRVLVPVENPASPFRYEIVTLGKPCACGALPSREIPTLTEEYKAP
jgi:hypothetical protein